MSYKDQLHVVSLILFASGFTIAFFSCIFTDSPNKKESNIAIVVIFIAIGIAAFGAWLAKFANSL